MKKFALFGLLVMLPCAAHADIIPTLTSITGAGNYTWNYQAQLTRDANALSGPAPTTTPVPYEAITGSFFTIYDFNDYISGTCANPTGWSCSVQNVGYTPNQVNPTSPPDSGSVVNLTWTYTTGGTIVGPVEINGFSAQSLSNLMMRTSFSSRTEKNVGPQAGTRIDNVGNVEAPMRLPEPASLGLLGMAFAGLALRRRKVA